MKYSNGEVKVVVIQWCYCKLEHVVKKCSWLSQNLTGTSLRLSRVGPFFWGGGRRKRKWICGETDQQLEGRVSRRPKHQWGHQEWQCSSNRTWRISMKWENSSEGENSEDPRSLGAWWWGSECESMQEVGLFRLKVGSAAVSKWVEVYSKR